MRIEHNRWTMALMFIGLLVLVGGCGSDEDPVQVTDDPPVEPRTPRELLSCFQEAYEARDAAKYLAILDPEFLFILREETAARFRDLGPALDFAEEERIHLRMFSGEGVIDPGGEPRPGVREVGWDEFQALDGWADSDDVDNFPNSMWAPFEVDLTMDCGQEFTIFKAAGQAKIYVREYSRPAKGEEITYYLLAGIVDLTQYDKGVESTPWGMIKAFYR